MSDIILSSDQISTLHKYFPSYRKWLQTENGTSNIQEHREHEEYFKEELAKEKIPHISETKFREIYKALWASNVWGNKDWYIDNKLLAPNGLKRIKDELSKLLYGEDDFPDRYDEFRSNIKGFGPSILTEILHFVYPDRYCLWNVKPKTVLPFLELNLLPEKFFKYSFQRGREYLQINRTLKTILDELKNEGLEDFIDLDIFFWYIHQEVVSKIPSKPRSPEKPETKLRIKPAITIDSHEAAEYYLLELGRMLGNLTYCADKSKKYNDKPLAEVSMLQELPSFASERDMNIARYIDVIWINEYENPTHCFEVEHTTDIVNGMDRLIQLQNLNTKFFIIAHEDRRTKFEQLLNRIHYRRIRHMFSFISYIELAELYEITHPFHNLKIKLLGE